MANHFPISREHCNFRSSSAQALPSYGWLFEYSKGEKFQRNHPQNVHATTSNKIPRIAHATLSFSSDENASLVARQYIPVPGAPATTRCPLLEFVGPKQRQRNDSHPNHTVERDPPLLQNRVT